MQHQKLLTDILNMRIWDVEPEKLCRKHLLGEHRELHALWTILSENRKGYRNHPETKRWVGKLAALYKRHDLLVEEMGKRKYNHNSPLDKSKATGSVIQNDFVHSYEEQIAILNQKNCDCNIL